MKKILSLLVLFCVTVSLHAQTAAAGGSASTVPDSPAMAEGNSSDDLMNMTADDYINLHLPPLHTLMENARERSPQVQMFAASKEYEEREVKTIRRSWMRQIKLNATYSYGSTDVNSQMYYENQYPIIQNVSGTTQRWWNVGASFALPLDEIFNRRNRIKQQQRRVESLSYEQERWNDDICMRIIEAYSNALQNLSMLRTLANTMIIAKAQYVTTETDFVNGKVDDQALSRQKNIENTAVRDYETARIALTKALLELEVLSKTPIISKQLPE